MTAIDTLLAGLFDYAGLYPPASLGMLSAVNNYLEYSRSKHGSALGRFIVNLDRLEEIRSIACDSLENFKLSVIASENGDWAALAAQIGAGLPIDAIEIKCSEPLAIESIAKQIPRGLDTYFEVPINANVQPALVAIRAAGARAKIRMGGVVPESFPTVPAIAPMLKALAELRLPFKATAGLHHPMRSMHLLTYEPQSPTSIMHGFVNLCCAAALLYFGGDVEEAQHLLADEDPTAWHVNANSLRWRDRSWSTEQLATLRRQFFISIGSCSFDEPIHDLESLGWL